jgi:hypothetical protein
MFTPPWAALARGAATVSTVDASRTQTVSCARERWDAAMKPIATTGIVRP